MMPSGFEPTGSQYQFNCAKMPVMELLLIIFEGSVMA